MDFLYLCLMTDKRLTFSFIGQRWKECIYFQHFFLVPTIATFTENIYGKQKKWMYQRIFSLYILWWEFSVGWKYRDVSKEGL